MTLAHSVPSELHETLEQQGGVLLKAIFSPEAVEKFAHQLDPLLAQFRDSASIRNREGVVYAARNVLQLFPDVVSVCQTPTIKFFLKSVLGADCGLVRVLFFDKPPGQTWALPWHKDITIAVRPPESIPPHADPHWNHIRIKAGVPHVEADELTLSRMLTLRIHLDPARSENGALAVSPGSHRAGKQLELDAQRELVIADAGDVFAMRPMLSHSSGQSAPQTRLRRRILHLEFAASSELPHGFTWHDFIPLDS